ncbi:MAG TPA: hemin uptake protein HemP [Mesorhizobium sp.]|nr:hemin uptake protein HemP [Mesorhizobium sp.]
MNSYNPLHLHYGQKRRYSVREHPAETQPPVRVVTSQSLFQGNHEIGIEHNGSLYRLKITRQGKLILNK